MRPCVVCGPPLDGHEPFYITTPPNAGVHETCRNWAKEKFPFAPQLNALRDFARELAGLQRDMVRVGKQLALWQRQWPEGALDAVPKGRVQLQQLRERIKRLADHHVLRR